MKKRTLLILSLLPLSFGCISNISTLPSPINSPVSILVTPSGLTTPTPSFPEPSFSPSVNVTPIPTSPNYPSPTVTPDPLEGYELYSKTVGCLPVDPNLKPKLDFPVDLAVTKDGRKVYVVNLRKKLNSEDMLRNKDYVPLLNRQYIYEIKDDKSINALKINNEYPFSCQLGEEIETDSSDNLYIVRNVYESTSLTYEVHKITPNTNISFYNKIVLNVGEGIKPGTIINTPSPSLPTIFDNLHIDNQGSVYYILKSGDIYYPDNVDKLSKLSKDGSIINVLTTHSGQIGDFNIHDGKIYTHQFVNFNNTLYIYNINFLITDRSNEIISIMNPSTPDTFAGSTSDKILVDKDKFVLGNSSRIIDNIGNTYISDMVSIWKITPDKKVVKFAGNGQAGYKDGKGEEAQFNNPTTMTFDGNGNMFVADSGNNAIRKITPDGTVSTFYKESN